MAKPLLEGGGVELALLHVRALNEMFQEGCLCLVLGQPSACQLVGQEHLQRLSVTVHLFQRYILFFLLLTVGIPHQHLRFLVYQGFVVFYTG